MSCVTIPIAVCTCARAHPTSVYQKRLNRSSSNLLCGWEPIGYEAFTCHGSHFTLRSASAHPISSACMCTPHICISGMAWPIALKFVVNLWPNQFARWAVCAVGGLRGGPFARWAVCAIGGLRGWRFPQLTVCAVGGLRGWRFARWLAVWAVGGLRDWRFARLAVCTIGGLRGGRFAWWAVCAVCVWWLAVCVWRFAFGVWRFAFGGLRFSVCG